MLGYPLHGTDKSVADAIFNGSLSDLKKSENDYDWLGSGLYFWENSHERALRWAQRFSKTKKKSGFIITEPAVIGAIIDLGHCLDLLEQKSIDLVKVSHDIVVHQFEVKEAKMPKNESHFHRLDCAVIENVHAMVNESLAECSATNQKPVMQHFDTVRAVFLEGNPLFDSSYFLDETHIQVCVRHPKNILGYFRPRI